MHLIEKASWAILIVTILVVVVTFIAGIMAIIDIQRQGGLPTVIGQWVNEYERARDSK